MESLKSVIDRHITAAGFNKSYHRSTEPAEIDEFYRNDFADVGGMVITAAFRGSLQDVTESIVTAVEETRFDLYVEPRSYVDSIKEFPISHFSWLFLAMAGFSDRCLPEDDSFWLMLPANLAARLVILLERRINGGIVNVSNEKNNYYGCFHFAGVHFSWCSICRLWYQ